MKLLLASKSPRRRQLISEIGWEYECVDIDVDEGIDEAVPASQRAELLARRKAESYELKKLAEDEVLVAADTVVVHQEQALGKPQSKAEAFGMLQALSGGTHQVYTGVCLRTLQLTTSFSEVTNVVFRALEAAEINFYIDHYQPFDKAGAYGIQEWIGMIGIERIEGCYYNVMGLPVSRLYAELKSLERPIAG